MSDYMSELAELYANLDDEDLDRFNEVWEAIIVKSEEDDDLIIHDLTEEQAKKMLDAWELDVVCKGIKSVEDLRQAILTYAM